MRHAEATGNVERRMQGQGGFSLTQKGQQQAQHLGQYLLQPLVSNLQHWPSAIYSSPIQRAKQTTEILIQVLENGERQVVAQFERLIPSPHYLDELREFNHGVLEGLTWAETQQAYPDLCQQLETTPTWISIPGAESLQSGRDRAQMFLKHLFQFHQSTETIWVISHEWILQHLIAVILGCDRTWQIPIHLTGIFEFEFDCDRWSTPGDQAFNSSLWKIRRFNDIAHLKNLESNP